ncbi:MAG: methyltransferase regulatory domain-containing protein [Bacillota bacterium]
MPETTTLDTLTHVRPSQLIDTDTGAPVDPQQKNAYDEVPYESHPYAQSRPERLATIATLFGMQPCPVDRCRVLELGCSSGGNIIPLAELYPNSQIVGIDASSRQIADGQKVLEKLGLANLRLETRNILDISPDFGQFDYIIAHGIFTWVPRNVQDKMLAICRDNLAPNGVAYISYNTYPGWHMRGIIRDMMNYRARMFDKPSDRVHHARALIDFLAQSVPAENNAFGLLLRSEAKILHNKAEYYLLHEHLEGINEPLYFHEFISQANEAKLQYLGEADFGAMCLQNFAPQIQKAIQSLSSDLVQIEQYMDFVRNRMFRQTLLCHAEAALERSISSNRVATMYVAADIKPENPIDDIRSTARTSFRGRTGTTATNDPLLKAALVHLGQIWPQPISFGELLATASSKINSESVVISPGTATPEAKRLADLIIRGYAGNMMDLSIQPPAFTTTVPDRPTASRHARLQAEASNTVTDLRHQYVSLGDLQRQVLPLLDGTNDRKGLLEKIVDQAIKGSIAVHENGQRVTDRSRLQVVLEKPLETTLMQLARSALLMR